MGAIGMIFTLKTNTISAFSLVTTSHKQLVFIDITFPLRSTKDKEREKEIKQEAVERKFHCSNKEVSAHKEIIRA